MEKTLVIMAAGMGSRFGGIKQIEPVGPNGEIISDYNIYNAYKNGFTKVVFIIRKHLEEVFKSDIITKYKDKIEIEFAYQELDTINNGNKVPSTREKMLGTAHALLCAKDKISGPFVVLNADDFYGSSAFKIASEFLNNNIKEFEYMNVTYPVKLVTSEINPVKRGIIYSENGIINKVVESDIIQKAGKAFAESVSTGEKFEVDLNNGCSMNFFVLKPSILEIFEKEYDIFLETIDDTVEFLLPSIIAKYIHSGIVTLYEEKSESNWYGITYKEDLIEFKEELNKLIEKGEYPSNLWG